MKRLWLDWANPQADLGLCWAHMSFFLFCCTAAQISLAFTVEQEEDADKEPAILEPQHDKTNKMVYASSEDSDQLGQQPSLIRVFAVHSVGSSGPSVSSLGQWRLQSDWADAQAHRSHAWRTGHFVGYVMQRLSYGSNEWLCMQIWRITNIRVFTVRFMGS